MKVQIETQIDDDPGFIAVIEKIISASIKDHNPEQVFVIYIKNWFDHKWLKFSGKGRVRFDDVSVWQPEIALAEFFRDRITFPPFTPNRILSQSVWAESKPNHSVHSKERKHSSWNLQKRVTQFADNAIFVWYSSASLSNQRGSLMVYQINQSGIKYWYASIVKKIAWIVDKTKRIDHEALVKIVEDEIEVSQIKS